jgi:hypothetical protein
MMLLLIAQETTNISSAQFKADGADDKIKKRSKRISRARGGTPL